jgi:hypothetical protein
VWTKYEKDVMTKPGRKEHIVPVLLDESGAEGAVWHTYNYWPD